MAATRRQSIVPPGASCEDLKVSAAIRRWRETLNIQVSVIMSECAIATCAIATCANAKTANRRSYTWLWVSHIKSQWLCRVKLFSFIYWNVCFHVVWWSPATAVFLGCTFYFMNSCVTLETKLYYFFFCCLPLNHLKEKIHLIFLYASVFLLAFSRMLNK